MRITFIIILLGLLSVFSAKGVNTPGTVSFSVTTVTDNGKYAPKNIMAIWVKDASGAFVKTLKVRAQSRIQYLYQWKGSSGLNMVDAITGATLSSHQTHSVTWNCKDLGGLVVPDGDYEFWVEFSEKDSQGPVTHFSFTKGITTVNTNYPNESRFINVTLTYTPQPMGVEEHVADQKVSVTKMNNIFVFKTPVKAGERSYIRIYNLQGQLVFESQEPVISGDYHIFQWEAVRTESIFLYRIVAGNKYYSGKIANAR